MYKAVFIDIDGTLKNDKGQITDRTKEAIKNATSKGIYVVICSGRPIHSTIEVSKESNASNYIICSNGAHIYDYKQEKTLYCNKMNDENCLRLYEIANKYDTKFVLNTENGRYVNKNEIDEDDDLIDKPIAEFLKEHDVSQCIFISPKWETIKEIKEIEIPKFKDVEIKNQSKCLTNPEEKPWPITYCDIANLDSSKGNGIKKFCEIMNIDLKDTMAFGDDYNDVPMFETVGHAVVMGNANDYIKKNYADEIAEDNNLDGVAKVLERILEEGV